MCVLYGAVMMFVMFCAENGDCVTCGMMISEVVVDVDADCCSNACCGVR